MAKITFDAQDGSPVQEFDVVLTPTAPVTPAVTEAQVQAAVDTAVENTFTAPAETPAA